MDKVVNAGHISRRHVAITTPIPLVSLLDSCDVALDSYPSGSGWIRLRGQTRSASVANSVAILDVLHHMGDQFAGSPLTTSCVLDQLGCP